VESREFSEFSAVGCLGMAPAFRIGIQNRILGRKVMNLA
jgi:hypothetical protein